MSERFGIVEMAGDDWRVYVPIGDLVILPDGEICRYLGTAFTDHGDLCAVVDNPQTQGRETSTCQLIHPSKLEPTKEYPK